MKYKNTLPDARKYNQAKDPKSKTADCSGCGDKVPMSGENCVEFGVYACKICREGEPMEDEKETISLEVSFHTVKQLERLAHYWKISRGEVLEKLIQKADSKAADEATRKGGVKAQTAYYDKLNL